MVPFSACAKISTKPVSVSKPIYIHWMESFCLIYIPAQTDSGDLNILPGENQPVFISVPKPNLHWIAELLTGDVPGNWHVQLFI